MNITLGCQDDKGAYFIYAIRLYCACNGGNF